MGKRSDRRKFRRRRRWAGFILLASLALMVFGVRLLLGLGSTDAQEVASRAMEKIGLERVRSTNVADAPAAVGRQDDEVAVLSSEEEDKKTPAEKSVVNKEAAQKAEEKASASAKQQAVRREEKEDPKPAGIPKPPTNDLWMSI